MKKLLSLLLVMIMVVALAVPAYAADDEIIINFPSVWVGTDSKAPYMTQLIDAFNAENAGSIKVVVEEQTDYQAARDKLRTTITTGATPDLCIMDTTYDIKGYSEAGKFMDLTPYLDEGWGNDFVDGALTPGASMARSTHCPLSPPSSPRSTTPRSLPRSAGIISPQPMTSSSSSAKMPRRRATTPWARWPAKMPGPPCSGTP